MAPEKRKFSRIPLAFELTILLNDGASYTVDHVENVSIGGCLVSLQPEFAHQQECSVRIALGGEQDSGPIIDIRGQIVRHNDRQVAIQFTRIDPDSLFHLQNLIRYNAPDPDRVDDEIQDHKGLR